MSDAFILTAITRDPAALRALDAAGLDRIGVDIECLGKHLRQDPGEGVRFSDHRLSDLAIVAANVRHAAVFARLNPLHAGTREEVDCALKFGARVLMLPYFKEPRQAASFLEIVDGRADTVLLVETAAAVAHIREIVSLSGVSEIMLGLNDLHRDMGLTHAFEVLTSDWIESVSRHVRDAGLRFGFGGIAQAFEDTLPVPSELVYPQYARLGATAAWLARSFYAGLNPRQIPTAVRQVRDRIAWWSNQPQPVLETQCAKLAAAIRALPGGRS
jgi:hypothetical protein